MYIASQLCWNSCALLLVKELVKKSHKVLKIAMLVKKIDINTVQINIDILPNITTIRLSRAFEDSLPCYFTANSPNKTA